MKIITETIDCTPQEYAELCNLRAEKEKGVAPGKTVADVLKQAEFYRKQMQCGRANF